MSGLALVDRMRVARIVNGSLTFEGDDLEELRQTILAAKEVTGCFAEHRAALDAVMSASADLRARAERETRLARGILPAVYAACAIVLAARSGGLIP